jgi:large conductance mechanosensitive channel
MSSLAKPNFGNMGKSAKNTLGGFNAFLLRGNVVDLAIGIVIGAAFTSVVNAFVADLITPIIPAGKTNLSSLVVPLFYGTGLKVGDFLNAVISFVIVAAVLYFFIVRPFSALMDYYKPQKVEDEMTRECQYCFQSVHPQATRCPHCTSPLTMPAAEAMTPVAGQQEML